MTSQRGDAGVPFPSDGLDAAELSALATEGQNNSKEKQMTELMKILAGGWFKGYRTQLLGWATVAGTVMYAAVQWGVGDVDFWGFLEVLKANWEGLWLGYAAVFVGDKVDAKLGVKK